MSSDKGSGPVNHETAEVPASQQEAKAFSWHAFVSTYLPALVLALGVGIALPAIPTLAKSFNVSFGVASWVTIAFLAGNVVGTVPSGWLIDRFGRRRVMLFGPLMTSAMAFLVVTAHTFPQLIVYRFIDGCAAQMWLMGRLAAISQRTAPNQRGRQVSWMFGMDSTGRLTGPVIGGFIAAAWGIRAPFIAYGFLALIALIPGVLFIEDTERRPRLAPGAKAPPRIGLRQLVQPRLVYFGVAFFAAMARGPVQADLLHLYAAFQYHLGPKAIGLLATFASCIALPIGFLAGWILDRYGRKKTMVPGFIGVSVAMTLLAASAYFHLSLGWYVLLFLIGVASQALTGGSIQTVGADVAPPEARGMFLGLWRFTGQAGTLISPIIFANVLSDHVGYGSAFLYISASAAVVAFLLIRYVPETGGKNADVVAVEPAAVSLAVPKPVANG